MKMITTILLGFLFLVIGTLVLAFMIEETSGKTITVDDDGGADYENIQDAIDEAENGDTVRVHDGYYKENVVVNKSINLIGNGSENTTIDGMGIGDVVQITANWVNMSLFHISKSGNELCDSGIEITSDNNLIGRCTFSMNEVCLRQTSSRNCTFDSNTCSEINKCGIIIEDSENSSISNSSFSLNEYNGIILHFSNNCTVDNNSCISNDIRGIYLYSCIGCTINHNTYSSNTGEGIHLEKSSYCTISNNTCSNNNDSGIYLEKSSHTMISSNNCSLNPHGIALDGSNGCIIEYNTCLNNELGIIPTRSTPCTITNNTCRNNDHGISLYSSNGCTITNNTIFYNRVGIFWIQSSRNNSIKNNKIYENIEYGIDVHAETGLMINMTHNYWGSDTGPYHPSLNPDGEGNGISDHIYFRPWLDKNGEVNISSVEDSSQTDDEGTHMAIILFSIIVIFVLFSTIFLKKQYELTKGKNEGKNKVDETRGHNRISYHNTNLMDITQKNFRITTSSRTRYFPQQLLSHRAQQDLQW